MICLFVLTQLTNVTDRQTHTHTQTPHDDIGRAYASHHAAKIQNEENVRDEVHDTKNYRWSVIYSVFGNECMHACHYSETATENCYRGTVQTMSH